MKFSTCLAATLAVAGVSGHSIVQKLSVNGQDQGQLKGVRAPSSNNPIQNVNDGAFACNSGIAYKDNNVISIPAGAKVGAWWGHVIGGAQGAGDADNPIAKSHKGNLFALLEVPKLTVERTDLLLPCKGQQRCFHRNHWSQLVQSWARRPVWRSVGGR